MAPPASGRIDFNSGWDSLWGALTDGYPGLTGTLTTVGLALIVWALVQWAWKARTGRNRGAAAKPVWGFIIIGSILSAPGVFIPLLLSVLEVVISIGLSVLGKAVGG